MAILKYADAAIVDVVVDKPEGSRLSSFDHLPADTFRTNDGYLYAKVRAISSRVNKNYDGWPVHELAGMHEDSFRDLVKQLDTGGVAVLSSTGERVGRVLTANQVDTRGEYGFKTFKGRPAFVDHNNNNPKRARGVIVDQLLYVEPSNNKYASDDYWSSAPDNHKPETWVELLIEVDAKSFPKLARYIKEGKVNAVSMGCNVDYTTCSICGNKAHTTDQYCKHIKRKGSKYITKDGIEKVAYEDCHGVNFFEISFVFDPADVTALTTGPIIAKTARPDSIIAPKHINTLDPDEKNLKDLCPLGESEEKCGLDVEAGKCELCGFVAPPPEYQDPNPEIAKDFRHKMEREKDEEKHDKKDRIKSLRELRHSAITLTNNETRKGNRQTMSFEGNDMRYSTIVASGTVDSPHSDEFLQSKGWLTDVDDDTAKQASTNSPKVPVAEDGKKASDEPRNQRVVEDQLAPVESNVKEAMGEKEPGDFKEEPQYKQFGTKNINEHSPGDGEKAPDLLNSDGSKPSKGADKEPQWKEEGGQKDIHERQPGGTIENNYPTPGTGAEGGNGAEGKPQFSEFTKDITEHHPPVDGNPKEHTTSPKGPKSSANLLTAMKIAEVEVELGLLDPSDKFNRAASLEDEALEVLEAQLSTFARVKEAGLKKVVADKKVATSFPSLKATRVTDVEVSDEAIFS